MRSRKGRRNDGKGCRQCRDRSEERGVMVEVREAAGGLAKIRVAISLNPLLAATSVISSNNNLSPSHSPILRDDQ